MRQNTRIWRFSPSMRLLCIVAPLVAVCLGGCNTGRYAPPLEYSPAMHDYLRADTSAAFNACVATCSENTSLALVTRTGCLEGCESARNTFPMTDRAYSARQECLDVLLEHKVNKDAQIMKLQRMCDDKWTHVHNRKGCRMAAEAFYAALTPHSVCGNMDAPSTVPSEVPTPAEPAPIPEEPAKSSPSSAPVLPTPAPATPDPTASAPAAPAPAATPPAAAAQPAPPAQQVTPTASQAPAPHVSTPGTLPAIHDTPKYQKKMPSKPATPPAGQMDSGSSPQTAPAATPLPLATPSPAPEKTEPAAPATVTPPATDSTKAQPSVITPPVASPEPSSDKTPAAGEPAIQPAATAPATKFPGTPTPADAPKPGLLAKPTVPTPATPASAMPETRSPETAPAPLASTPGTEQPVSAPSSEPITGTTPPTVLGTTTPESAVRTEPAPGSNSGSGTMPVRKGPPIPGLNADRPIPQQTKPAEPAATRVTPPVPSMLNRAYAPPTILAPQIDIPPAPPGN